MSILDSLRNPPRVATRRLCDAPGFEWAPGNVWVQEDGVIMRGTAACKPGRTTDGYENLFIGGRTVRYHRAVAACWAEGWTSDSIVDHIDGNRKNNHPSNLRAVDSKENAAFLKGKNPKKLKPVDVIFIKGNEAKLFSSVTEATHFTRSLGLSSERSPISRRAKHNTALLNGEDVKGGLQRYGGWAIYYYSKLPQTYKQQAHALL